MFGEDIDKTLLSFLT